MNYKRFLFIISFATIILAIGTNVSVFSVYGHASPITYNPSPSEKINLQSVPEAVTITFTERPEIRASNIKVLNSNNERVDNNDLKIGDTDRTLTISLDNSKIKPGIYTVDWLVLSKDDGHITKGTYVFTVVGNNNGQNQTPQGINMSSVIGYSKNITTPNNINLKFSITPYAVGKNTFNLTITHENGTAVGNVEDVYLEFYNPSKGLGPIVEIMEKVDEGEYSSTGYFLSQTGNWEIKVTIQRMGEYDINQQFDVNIID
ncbi:MAG: copper resistance protein CopC [Candidatus Nitrosocosmicus sp.]|nr:copper resistance protein CopC [Candidatus Nitrosocosmicus sp.]